jgi:hypothetical protein
MRTRRALLDHIWHTVINSNLDVSQLESIIGAAIRHPDAPFADTGAAVQRLLALGGTPEDLCLLRRDAAYRAVFATLYALGDPGAVGNDVLMLHEELLSADPSGLDGRPGSAKTV